jgi:FAD/FMN-containing dehydrogenase
MNVSTLSSRESRTAALAREFATLLGDPARVLTAPAVVERLSRDFYWYSPVLRKLLDGKTADLVVQPTNAAEVQSVLAFARDRGISVTARGAGTGNYGQAVPLEGGIVLDLSLFDKLEEITSDGVAVCQPGLRLGQLEIEAGKQGWELRCYPSTIAKGGLEALAP